MQAAEASIWAGGNSISGTQLDGTYTGPRCWLHPGWGWSVDQKHCRFSLWI